MIVLPKKGKKWKTTGGLLLSLNRSWERTFQTTETMMNETVPTTTSKGVLSFERSPANGPSGRSNSDKTPIAGEVQDDR